MPGSVPYIITTKRERRVYSAPSPAYGVTTTVEVLSEVAVATLDAAHDAIRDEYWKQGQAEARHPILIPDDGAVHLPDGSTITVKPTTERQLCLDVGWLPRWGATEFPGGLEGLLAAWNQAHDHEEAKR